MFRMLLTTLAIVMLLVTQPHTAMAQSETHVSDNTAPPAGSNRVESSMTVDCQSIDEWPEEGQQYAIDHDLCPPNASGESTQDVVYGNCGSSSFYLVNARDGRHVHVYMGLSSTSIGVAIAQVNWFYDVYYDTGDFSFNGTATPLSTFWNRASVVDTGTGFVFGYMGGQVFLVNGISCLIDFPYAETNVT